MILTCPECATSYFVDDSRIPTAGRSVKCSSCGHRWTAVRESGLAGTTPEADPADAETSGVTAEAAPAPELAAEPVAPEDDLAFVPRSSLSDRPGAARGRRAGAAADARSKVLVWAAAATVVAVLVAGALLFRANVVRLWPQSGAAYASLGLPVNASGLVIENVKAEPTFQGGRPALSVTGAIRNLRDQAMTTPAIRVSLLNGAGKPVAAKILHPLDARVPGGAQRHFAIAIVDPPASAHDLEVTFEDRPPVRAAIAPPPLPAEPAPVDAKPLPPGSPDVLPEHG